MDCSTRALESQARLSIDGAAGGSRQSGRKGSSLPSSRDPQMEGAGGPHPAGSPPSVQSLSCRRVSVAPTPVHCSPPEARAAAVTAVSLKSVLHKSSA